MNSKIYYAHASEDRWEGPVTIDELKSLAERQELKHSDLIWAEGMTVWQPAGLTPAIFEGLERRLLDLKDSVTHLIQAGNYKLAVQELDKTLVEFGPETELWETNAQTETASTDGVVETLLRELFNLRKQAQAGQENLLKQEQADQDRVAELTEKLIPTLLTMRKFAAVLECIDESVQLGADETFVRPIRQQADSAIQEAGALAEQGGQLLAAKKPAEAIKEFNKALQICADFSRATEGVASAAQAIFNKNAMIVAVSVVVIVILLRIGIPAVHNWKANSAWAQAQQDIKLAGDNQSRIKDSYQKYLASFPDGKKAEIAQQAVAQIQQAEDARQQKLAEEERLWELAKAEAERQQELAEHERQRQAHYDSGVEKQAKRDLDDHLRGDRDGAARRTQPVRQFGCRHPAVSRDDQERPG